MVFHKNCDLLTALSIALGKQKSAHGKICGEPETTEGNPAPSIDEKITTVAAHLNQKLHEQAKTYNYGRVYNAREVYKYGHFSHH